MMKLIETLSLNNVQRGKFFRIVADVMIDGKSSTAALIDAGYGVPHNSGTKAKDWWA